MLQLRILGSVRANFNYTDQKMEDHQTFNPYEIPTEINTFSPNFFAGLQQTRLGFEVTRRTKRRGNVFVRIEGDFKNSSTSFRIRHAYGQMGSFLIGQTWSLFNNISYQPALVSMDGPASGSGLRTPQIRYTQAINKNMKWSAAIEYSSPNFNIPDSIDATVLQVIPDLTARYSYKKDKLSFRVVAIITTISGRLGSNDINYEFGFGGSFAGKMKVKKNGELYMSVSFGRAISHFFDLFSGKGEDMSYNSEEKEFEALHTSGGYLAYGQDLPKNFSTSLSFGMAFINNKEFQPSDAYSYSYNALLNIFWQPVDGARLGIEFANGQRFNKGGGRGMANRVSILLYYDF